MEFSGRQTFARTISYVEAPIPQASKTRTHLCFGVLLIRLPCKYTLLLASLSYDALVFR